MKDSYRPAAAEFDGMQDWERTLWLSHSYLEASIQLCIGMVSGDFTAQYSSSRVILHLARHGIELFLKGVLLAAGIHPAAHGHHLVRLYRAYRGAYPPRNSIARCQPGLLSTKKMTCSRVYWTLSAQHWINDTDMHTANTVRVSRRQKSLIRH